MPGRSPLVAKNAAWAALMVANWAHRKGIPRNSRFSTDDLVQEGMIGLIDAATRWDPAMRVEFRAFAYPRVIGAALDFMRREDALTRHDREELTKAQKRGRDHAPWKHGDPLPAPAFVSLDEVVEEDVRGDRYEVVPDCDAPSPEDEAAWHDFVERVEAMIADLPDRHRMAIALYFYEGMSLKEVGEVIGVSESRVSQLISRDLQELRSRMESGAARRRRSSAWPC